MSTKSSAKTAFDIFAGKRNPPIASENDEKSVPTSTPRACPGGNDQMDSKVNLNSAYKSFMEKLQDAASSGFKDVHSMCTSIQSKLPSLELAEYIDFSSNEIDDISQKLIPTNQASDYVALRTTGDGNCLFRAASMLAFGDENRHEEMRVRTVVELACNSSFYLDDPDISSRIQAQEQLIYARHGKKRNSGEVNMKDVASIFQAEVVGTCNLSTEASYWHLQALGAVFHRRVRSVYPQCGSEVIRKYFDAVICPREFDPEKEPLVIMWTNTKGCNTTEFQPNHFVPLTPNKIRSSRDEPGKGGRFPPHNVEKPMPPSAIRDEFEKRRSSLPSCFPKKEEKPKTIQHHISEPSLPGVKKERQLKLGDPLAKSLLDNLELLEGLGRCLDKEHRYGMEKCWKHLAEYFEVEANIYEDFTYSRENSPTEDLFEFLKTRTPQEFTLDQLKDKLNSIDRQDVIQDVILKHQQLHKLVTHTTQVGSLFDRHPDLIGEMAFLLDKETSGIKNWKQLADKFDVPRSVSEKFGDPTDYDPSMDLLDHLIATRDPPLTIGDLKKSLKDLKLQEVFDVVTQSDKVKDDSHLEDLWDDLQTLESLCHLLNKKHTSGKIRRWRYLGNILGVDKKVLYSISTTKRPTKVLIQYLGAVKPWLKMEALILALDAIGKSDALAVLKDYFPDDCILKVLEPVRASRDKNQQKTTPSTYNETAI